MEKKKVLLVVAGGRAVPDVLALFYVQPQIVIVITSEEGWGGEDAFVEIATGRPNHEFLDFIRNVNAYKLNECMQACDKTASEIVRNVFAEADYQLEWVFAIGSAPKIPGIAAYEVAKKRGIPCLVVDTLHEKFVSLVRDVETDFDVKEQELFHPDVSSYMRMQRRMYRIHKEKIANYRAIVEGWGHIAQVLALSSDIPDFTFTMHDKKAGILVPLSPDLNGSPLLHTLEKYKVIEVKSNNKGQQFCAFTSSDAARFIGTGDWLEVFVWHEARAAGFADDCQWGYEIIDGRAENELDLALTYKAQLLIGECKTDYNPFRGKRNYLDTLDSNAHLLGGHFVTKLFITNQPRAREGNEAFKAQADKRRIVVLTAEDLPNIREHLEREAKHPTYARI